MIELYLSGLFVVGTLLSVWNKVIPPTWITGGSYNDREGWIIHASTAMGRLGRLLTCDFCLSVHLSFWVAVALSISFSDSLTDACLLVVSSTGWPFILQLIRPAQNTIPRTYARDLKAPPVKETGTPTQDKSSGTKPSKPSEHQQGKTPEPQKGKTPLSPEEVEKRKAFMKSRGIDGTVDPETGVVQVNSVSPVHQKVQNLLRDTDPEPCFFEGCSELIKPYLEKSKQAQDGNCPACELGKVRNEVYDKIITHLKTSGQYEELNS